MSKRFNKDLDDLLDSMVSDHTMDEKIDDFSHARHQPEPEIILDIKGTQQEDPHLDFDPDEEEDVLQAPADHGSTMVFKAEGKDTRPEPSSGTVIMNDGEIQQLIEEEKGPRLQRKKVSSKKKSASHGDWKVAGIIVGGLGIIALGGLLMFGISQAAGNLFSSSEKTEETDADFSRLKEFASQFNSSNLNSVTAYESIYNKLTSAQKDEIDSLLQERVGKTFSEILAQAKADKENQQSNDKTTEIAEKKASLKKQISSLQSQLAAAQSQQNSQQQDINAKLQAYNNAQADYNQAATNYTNAQGTVNSLQAQIDQVVMEINTVANGTYDNDEDMIAAQNRVSELYKQKSSLETSLSQAQQELAQTGSALDSTTAALDEAQQTYESASADTSGLQDTINSLNSQIASLQSQLDALN